MKPTLPRLAARSIPILVLVAAAPMLLAAFRPVHLELARSAPEEGSTVHAVSEVRLWFSEAPMDMGPSSVAIRILSVDDRPITTGNAVRDSKDAEVYSLALPRGLEPGRYSIAWQTMAADGDVVRDRFSFTVAAH